jgi:hypothetical protein
VYDQSNNLLESIDHYNALYAVTELCTGESDVRRQRGMFQLEFYEHEQPFLGSDIWPDPFANMVQLTDVQGDIAPRTYEVCFNTLSGVFGGNCEKYWPLRAINGLRIELTLENIGDAFTYRFLPMNEMTKWTLPKAMSPYLNSTNYANTYSFESTPDTNLATYGLPPVINGVSQLVPTNAYARPALSTGTVDAYGSPLYTNFGSSGYDDKTIVNAWNQYTAGLLYQSGTTGPAGAVYPFSTQDAKNVTTYDYTAAVASTSKPTFPLDGNADLGRPWFCQPAAVSGGAASVPLPFN